MRTGLYTPGEFKDNCGFGLLAHLQGQPSHRLLKTAIESSTCMTHRGGIAADGKTGDGCGLLLQKPDSFLRAVTAEAGMTLPARYAVGMLFMDLNETVFKQQQDAVEQAFAAQGLPVIGWRTVPTNNDCLGPIALSSLPRFEQVFVAPAADMDETQFAVKLFYARRLAEKALDGQASFYVASLAERVVSYKGLMMPVDLPNFYPDLGDERMETAICVFHQRFSTNTMPRWPLAQPFRLLAHNGEINTITANRNWAQARRTKFANPLLPDLESLAPLVNVTGSDSSSMDNMLELLLTGGMDLFRAVRMIVPPAWQNMETMDADLRAFHEFNSMHMEAWDGPAGIVLTEGRHAVCLLDRNGLRPARYVITRNGYITLASEIGVWNYSPEDVISKGRVGPGQILAVDTHTGEVLHTDEVDNRLKSRHPYRKWLKQNALRIQGTLDDRDTADEFLAPEPLQEYMKMFQVSFEERDQVLRPLGENGQEAVGSMGDDTR